MKTNLKKLIRFYGGKDECAKALGIKRRHLNGVLSGKSPYGESLAILARLLCKLYT